MRRLEDSGVVVGYSARVDPVAAGRPVRAVVRMHCYGPTCLLRDPAVAQWPEVHALYRVTGEDCSVLLVACTDLAAFEALLDRLAAYGQPTSSLVLDAVVSDRAVQPPVA